MLDFLQKLPPYPIPCKDPAPVMMHTFPARLVEATVVVGKLVGWRPSQAGSAAAAVRWDESSIKRLDAVARVVDIVSGQKDKDIARQGLAVHVIVVKFSLICHISKNAYDIRRSLKVTFLLISLFFWISVTHGMHISNACQRGVISIECLLG